MNSLSSLILILISAGLFYVFTMPQYEQVKSLSATSGEYKEVMESVSAIKYMRDRLLIEYESIPPVEIDRLNKILPDNIDTVRLALDLDTMAANYGIAISQFSADVDSSSSFNVSEEGGMPYSTATVTFKFVSNYQNFMLFLADLEKSLRLLDVKSVSFSVAENNIYEHQISASVYWLR